MNDIDKLGNLVNSLSQKRRVTIQLQGNGQKADKAQVNYRTYNLNEGLSSVSKTGACGKCIHFNPATQDCDVVEGDVRAEDTCDLYQS